MKGQCKMGLIGFNEFVKETIGKKDPVLDNVTTQIQYPTGFMWLDYAAGNSITVYNDDEVPQFYFHNVGITMGSLNTIIAKSQGGKTSLSIKMGAAILEPWILSYLKNKIDRSLNPKIKELPKPMLQIIDTEGTSSLDYVKKLTHYRNRELKNYVRIDCAKTDKELQYVMSKHCEYKEKCMEKMYLPQVDIYGDHVYTYPPTVMIIDSMTDVQVDEVTGSNMEIFDKQVQNTAGMQRAKRITQLTTNLNYIAKKYNIIIFNINHINMDPQVSMMPQPKQYRGLKQGEKLNGGERAIYLATNILRLDVIKAIGSEKASMLNLGDDITGFVTMADWIKCKSNSRRNKPHLIYTNEHGYDTLLSNLYYAKEREVLPKKGNFFYLPGFEEHKFTLKTARSVFQEHPELITALYESMKEWAEPMLDNADYAAKQARKQEKEDLDSMIKFEVSAGTMSHSEASELEEAYSFING